MADKTILHQFNSGMVLDRSLFIACPSVDMAQIIHNIRAAGHEPIYVVDGAESFFTMGSLLELIAAKDKRYAVVNEALGGFFTEAQIDVLMANNNKIIQPVVAPVDEQPDQFSPVPAGWSIGQNMSLGLTKIKRKVKNSDGDGTVFWMSPESFKELWLFAANVWSGCVNAPLMGKFTTGIGVKKATVGPDNIIIGGNYIRRYEIEQVAKYRGWAIPAQMAQLAA